MQFHESSDTDRGAGVDLDEGVHVFQAVTIVLYGKAADFELKAKVGVVAHAVDEA